MWTLKTNDNSYELLAVSVSPEKSIFADRDEGTFYSMDGQLLKGGFINIDDKVLISNEEGFVLVKENGKVKYRYKCKNWDKNNEGENKIFTQNCIGRYNVINKIVVNKSGFIEEISQGITNTNKPWILSKN